MEEREGCDRRASRRRSLAWDRRGRFSGAWLGEFVRRYFVLWEKARVWICFSQIQFEGHSREIVTEPKLRRRVHAEDLAVYRTTSGHGIGGRTLKCTLRDGVDNCGRLARKILEAVDDSIEAGSNLICDSDAGGGFRREGTTRGQAREAGSGFAGGGAAGLSREDGVCGEAGAVHAGLSEMDSGGACAEWADCGCDGREGFWRRERRPLAAGYGGYVRIGVRGAGGRGKAGSNARLFVGASFGDGGSGIVYSADCGIAVESGGALSEGYEIGR